MGVVLRLWVWGDYRAPARPSGVSRSRWARLLRSARLAARRGPRRLHSGAAWLQRVAAARVLRTTAIDVCWPLGSRILRFDRYLLSLPTGPRPCRPWLACDKPGQGAIGLDVPTGWGRAGTQGFLLRRSSRTYYTTILLPVRLDYSLPDHRDFRLVPLAPKAGQP